MVKPNVSLFLALMEFPGELPSAPTSDAEVSPGTAAKLVWEPSRAIFPEVTSLPNSFNPV